MKIRNQILSFVAILVVALMTFLALQMSQRGYTFKSIVDIAKADPTNFSILVDALKKTGLEATLTSAGSYCFCPTNAALQPLVILVQELTHYSHQIMQLLTYD
jgi:uncharacterized surface protein with fasciclin (FAS1) repeats